MKSLSRFTLVFGLLAGCQQSSTTPLNGDAFVAINRTDDALTTDQTTLAKTVAPSNSVTSSTTSSGSSTPASVTDATGSTTFYLAIKKDQLAQRWFLSAYLSQLFPGAVSQGAAESLGTRVVSFKEQNGKLYVFDASNGKETSNTFDPSLLIDAYPIVTYAPFNKLPHSGDYILVDPSQSLGQFSFFNDFYGEAGIPFTTTLSFLQNFRTLKDGATFEQVFTGYASPQAANPNSGALGENNQLRASGTLGISLRQYSEGSGFVPKSMPSGEDTSAGEEYFFRSELQLVNNTGATQTYATRWNLSPTNSNTIDWVISNHVQAIAALPQYQGLDVIGSIERGVTNWNMALGYNALTVRLATADENEDQDDKNYIIFDEDPTNAYAFANWRDNPNTGETRGASVYFNTVWLEAGLAEFVPQAAPDGGTTARSVALQNMLTTIKTNSAAQPRLFWGPLGHNNRLCSLSAETAISAFLNRDLQNPTSASTLGGMSPVQAFESFITHVVLHEVGHTLGLRHNFKGSLVGTSSSVMEYILDEYAIQHSRAGAYDVDALNYLYAPVDSPPSLPTEPFCTDEQTQSDPDCATFDATADPLNDFWAPFYQSTIAQAEIPNDSLNGILKYVRACATPAIRTNAWNIAVASSRLPLAAATDATYADQLFHNAIQRLWLDDPSLQGDITGDPIIDQAADGTASGFYADALDQMNQTLLNQGQTRSYDTRRGVVDVLKHLQRTDALIVLQNAATTLAKQVPSLTGDDAALTQDLVNRINTALGSYFN